MTQEQALSQEQAPPTRIPGAMVLSGRYRLLVRCGSLGAHTFWQAMDSHLNRHVALTFTSNAAPEALRAAMVLAKLSSPGLARIFDITNDQGDLVVITEWVAGAPLREVALSRPSALGSANALTALADAAAAAHENGALLGVDDPIRVRISNDGEAVLAYPSVSATQTRADDVRALGGTLYALLTGQWPENAGGGSAEGGLPLAKQGPDGALSPARELNPAVPASVSDAADAALGSKVSAEQFRDLLERALSEEDEAEEAGLASDSGLQLDLGLRSSAPAAASPAPAFASARSAEAKPDGEQSLRERLLGSLGSEGRSRKTLIIGGALVAAIVLLLGYGAYSLVDSVNGGGSSGRPLVPGQPNAAATGGPAAPVKASDAQVVDFKGDPSGLDDPREAKNAVDGSDSTYWQTDLYNDGPKMVFKPGIGLLVTLEKAVKLQQVTISSPSNGTAVEVYAAKSPNTKAGDVKKLDDLVKIGSGQVNGQSTTITCNTAQLQPSTVVLVWLTSLSPSGSQYRSRINEVAFSGSQA
ncbi:MAG: protein kinase family protein [Segniliparus sp.]|uniref:protein kinase family protein n=1 Tax=Segniliparus sp. TaxID=2804064 RepID=UPI003F3CB1DA